MVVWPRLDDPFVTQNPREVLAAHSPGRIMGCAYHLFVWSSLIFLHNSLWITFLTEWCLVLYSFCGSLLNSLIMWLIVSSLSPAILLCLVYYFLDIILMGLCCARRDSVSLLRFPLLSHVHVFSCEISLVCRLKCPYSCFSSHFCFLLIFVLLMHLLFVLILMAVIGLPLCFLCSLLVVVLLSVLFLVAVISLPPGYSIYSSSFCIDASTLSSMMARPLPPSFIDTYCLSTSSLGCKALCMVISFRVLKPNWRSSSHVHFKNGPEYLTVETAQLFILLMTFLLYSLFLSSFLVSLDTLIKFFPSSPFVWWCPLPIFRSICKFLFLLAFWPSLSLLILFLLLCVVSRFSLSAWHIFLCQIPCLCPDCIFSLTELDFPILFPFCQTVWYRPCKFGDRSFPAI